MAWTAPGTWSVGESPTAAKLNSNLRDNMTWLHDSIPAAASLHGGATIANNTWTAITFVESFDNDTIHDDSTNPTRYTITTAGRYLFVAQVAFKSASNAVGLGARFLLSGVTSLAELKVTGCSQDGNGLSIQYIFNAAAADYMEVQVWQNSGGALDTYPSMNGCFFGATRL